MIPDAATRMQLIALLRGGQAHKRIEEAVADFPVALRGKQAAGYPHSPWHLIEHIRIAQHDILEFSRNDKYKAMNWPDDYWPSTDAPPAPDAWDKSVAQIRADLLALEALIADTENDLYAPIAWGEGENLLREAMLAADHTAYHLGQLVLLRAVLEG